MSETLTPQRALILWCLLGRQGWALQGDVRPAVKKLDREALVAKGLLSAEKHGRSLLLSVTDKGWHWAGEHLRDPLPESHGVLRDWLDLLHRHLETTGGTLADFVGLAPEPPPPPLPEKQAAILKALLARHGSALPREIGVAVAKADRDALERRGLVTAEKAGRSVRLTVTEDGRRWASEQLGLSLPDRSEAARPPDLGAVRARILAAYLALTDGRRSESVRLSRLRAELRDLDRATVDAALAEMLREDDKARFLQFTDPRSVDAAERAAAFSPAGEPFHILWIEP
ncbi:hypothetical protein [Methylobacterium sp. JK268]